jgi:pimeloyl-ACP methyl ester carboxylesterase
MCAPREKPGYFSFVIHHVYFSPGMFGFNRLASFEYFAHVERALAARFEKHGIAIDAHVSDVLPTASLRRRAAKLAELIGATATTDGPIHLIGHSTGGLDSRLVASPCSELPANANVDAWIGRLKSVTTMNTPHYGTPLASFFATSKGQQALYALSAFTVIGLSIGARPLAVVSALISIIGKSDRAIGITLPLLDSSVKSVLSLMIDDARNPDVRTYLKAMQEDSGAMLQLSPEAMDLMVAGFENRKGVTYQSTASMAPSPSPTSFIKVIGHPWQSISLALFTALHGITALVDKRYPCAAVPADLTSEQAAQAADNEAMLRAAFTHSPETHDNDGCVPIRSQLWGRLVWAGYGDHLDVLGHYNDVTPEKEIALRHYDWLTSGSKFDDASFESLMDAVAGGMLKSVE